MSAETSRGACAVKAPGAKVHLSSLGRSVQSGRDVSGSPITMPQSFNAVVDTKLWISVINRQVRPVRV